jgi:hypothetical protein
MKCLQCQSERLVHKAKAVDYFDMAMKKPLKLELDSNPDAWLFKGTQAGELNASVCADCGFVMFSMAKEDAEKLYRIQNDR